MCIARITSNRVSRRARTEGTRVARVRTIPVLLRHSCGGCAFRSRLDCLMTNDPKCLRDPHFGGLRDA